jgi:hypothetical protein
MVRGLTVLRICNDFNGSRTVPELCSHRMSKLSEYWVLKYVYQVYVHNITAGMNSIGMLWVNLEIKKLDQKTGPRTFV